MVGRTVANYCSARGDQVKALDHTQLDIANRDLVFAICAQEKPDALINCAAWTDVDACESDPDRATAANALGPEILAAACRQENASLVTVSTDYVFDGTKSGFYTQRDQPNPQGVYAASKLQGERRAQNMWARTTVVRTGYIFGPGGKNFLSTLVSRARSGAELNAIDDMFGTPTYVEDLARRLHELALLDLPGIYHVTNSGDGVSFADFARAALREMQIDSSLVRPVSLISLNRPAPRPRNSRLRCLLSGPLGLPPLRDWQNALREFVQMPGN
jgi:dTDP-4-dehydrorhamnose reductase